MHYNCSVKRRFKCLDSYHFLIQQTEINAGQTCLKNSKILHILQKCQNDNVFWLVAEYTIILQILLTSFEHKQINSNKKMNYICLIQKG